MFGPGHVPDLLTIAFLDSTATEIPATGVANEFLSVSVQGGAAPVVAAAGSANRAGFVLAAPLVQTSPVQELFSLALGALVVRIGAASVWRISTIRHT